MLEESIVKAELEDDDDSLGGGAGKKKRCARPRGPRAPHPQILSSAPANRAPRAKAHAELPYPPTSGEHRSPRVANAL
jgi:hypothetical protein